MFSKLMSTVLALVSAGCGVLPAQQVVIPASGGRLNLTASNITFSSMTMLNCVAAPLNCAPVIPQGDPYSTGGLFSGYADPTERQDPLTGTLWLAYSWPDVTADGTKVVDIHVAYSTDSGTTWSNTGLSNNGVLYSSQLDFNGVTQSNNHSSHEVMELYPQVVGSTTYWYGMHSMYDVPVGGSGTGQAYTVRQAMAACPGTPAQGPMCLGVATTQFLGGTDNNQPAYYPISANLTSISGLTNCTNFREPTFIMQSVLGVPTLFLFVNCGDMSSYAQFATPNPQNSIGNWSWTYTGDTASLPASSGFATISDASGICSFFASCASTNYLTQSEVALAAGGLPGLPAGTMIDLFDVVHLASGNKVSSGVVVTALSRLSPPALVRTASGAVKVFAVIPSTDSMSGGPGTATYDPASAATGIIMAHKLTACTGGTAGCNSQGGLYTYLMSTGVKP